MPRKPAEIVSAFRMDWKRRLLDTKRSVRLACLRLLTAFLRRLDVGLHADRHQPLAVAPHPDAGGAIGRTGTVPRPLRCDHRCRIAVNRKPHGLYFADRHWTSGLFLPLDRGDARRFIDRSVPR